MPSCPLPAVTSTTATETLGCCSGRTSGHGAAATAPDERGRGTMRATALAWARWTRRQTQTQGQCSSPLCAWTWLRLLLRACRPPPPPPLPLPSLRPPLLSVAASPRRLRYRLRATARATPSTRTCTIWRPVRCTSCTDSRRGPHPPQLQPPLTGSSRTSPCTPQRSLTPPRRPPLSLHSPLLLLLVVHPPPRPLLLVLALLTMVVMVVVVAVVWC